MNMTVKFGSVKEVTTVVFVPDGATSDEKSQMAAKAASDLCGSMGTALLRGSTTWSTPDGRFGGSIA